LEKDGRWKRKENAQLQTEKQVGDRAELEEEKVRCRTEQRRKTLGIIFRDQS
jgi:hypothetical protein